MEIVAGNHAAGHSRVPVNIRRALLVVLALWLGAMARVASATESPAVQDPAAVQRQPLLVPHAEEYHLRMRDGRQYRLFVSWPDTPPPPSGFPVIYILDGNSVFGTLRDEVRRESADTYQAPAVIVAIGYPGDAPWDDERRQYDLTPVPPPGVEPLGPAGYAIPHVGGADIFLDFLEHEVLPMVEHDYPVDPGRRTLAGHSLGGLFVLHALFQRPGLFHKYVAMSPSIWYSQRMILHEEEATRAVRHAHPQPARVLLTIGGCEQTPGECDPGVPRSAQKDRWLESEGRMVDDVVQMTARLNASGTGVDANSRVFAAEHHESVIGASISALVRFALSPAEQ